MNFTLFSLASLLLFFTCFVLAIFIFLNCKTSLHKMWGWFNITAGLWGLGAFFLGGIKNKELALLIWRIVHIPVIFIPITMFQVVDILCNLKSKKFLYFIYIQGFIFSILTITSDSYISNVKWVYNTFYYYIPGYLFYIFFSIWGFIVAYTHFKLFLVYQHSSGKLKIQILYLFIAFIVGFSGGITNFFPAFGINIYPFGNLTIPLYCSIAAYAILRYRLMDIHLIIKRYGVYSLATGLLAASFVILLTALTKYLSDLTKMTSLTVTGIAAVIITLLFNPLKNKIQSIIDKIFYKKTYDYYDVLQKISHELANTLNLEEIYNFISNTVLSTLGLQNIYLLQSTAGNEYQTIFYATNLKDETNKNTSDEEQKMDIKPTINKTADLIKLILASKDLIIKDELNHIADIKDEVIENISNDLKPFSGEAVLPIFIDNKLEFILILGDKTSKDIFSNEDVKLLNTISTQSSIAIKKAQLHVEKARSERLASLGMMSATFAHEIKNPLTSIKTFAELIPEQYMDHEFRETFSKIVLSGVKRIDGLITDLLMFSSDKIIVDKREFDLLQYMDQMLTEMEINFKIEKKKVVTIEKNCKDANIYIFGDEKKLRQVFVNLITNAFEAIPNGRKDGLIKINIQLNEKFVDIFIVDNGIGVALEDMSKLFEPFFTKKTTGVGLGLVITKKIIDAHSGKISVASTFKRGTTFTVSLPI